jgi:hypothetical protein
MTPEIGSDSTRTWLVARISGLAGGLKRRLQFDVSLTACTGLSGARPSGTAFIFCKSSSTCSAVCRVKNHW